MICTVKFKNLNEHNKVYLSIRNFKIRFYFFSFLERAKASELREKAASGILPNTNVTTNSRQLLILDESALYRLVAARLDLPISQRLLDQNFKLSIIQKCWEDQLRLKREFKKIKSFILDFRNIVFF
jgi:hypothetical protein